MGLINIPPKVKKYTKDAFKIYSKEIIKGIVIVAVLIILVLVYNPDKTEDEMNSFDRFVVNTKELLMELNPFKEHSAVSDEIKETEDLIPENISETPDV